VRDGDFLFSRANTVELVGSVAIVRNPPDGLLLPDKIWRLRWGIPFAVQPQYMLALFQNRSTRSAMAKLATGTSDSMRNISQGRLKSLRVPIPPLSEQRAFAERVADIQATIDQIDRAATAAVQLQAALMARLFDGA
jgi:type I restriction enzyme S subunit